MADQYKKTKALSGSFPLNVLEKMHPYKMLLLIALFGSAMIFFFLLMAYSASRPLLSKPAGLQIPKGFIISTLLLLASSFTIRRTVEFFKKEKKKKLKKALLYTLLLGFAFSFSQFFGWNELMLQNVYSVSKNAAVYLYTLSAMHILHMIAAIIYLAYCYIVLIRKSSDIVHQLLYFTNPFRGLQLEILVTLWHFMDGLWMALFLYFLFIL